MNISIAKMLTARTLIGLIYGFAFGYIGRQFGLSLLEMFALLCLSAVWMIVTMVIDSNRVRSTPSVSTDRLEDDRNE